MAQSAVIAALSRRQSRIAIPFSASLRAVASVGHGGVQRVAPALALRAVAPSPAATPAAAALLPSRRFQASSSALPVQIYQYEICPFCCKLKAFMDWQKMPYSTVEVNPLSKAEIKFSEGYRKVPIAKIDGTQVNGSTEILAALIDGGHVTTTGLAAGAVTEPDTAKWLEWCDKELAVLLFPNITRNFGESWQAFRYIGEVPSFGAGTKVANQLAGSIAMWLANGKLKKKYNITDERKQLLDTVQVWVDAVGDGPFLKGQTISLSDVAVYGVLSSIRGLATYDEMMKASPALAKWVAAVRDAIGSSARLEEPRVVRRFGPTAATE